MEDAQRWSVTYTKHVKQKRKVYQDGYLELQSSRHKVMVYDEWDKLLESRFLKKDDVIKSGETLAFSSYLVDIGEQCGSHKPTSTLSAQEKDTKVTEKSGSLYGHNSADRKPTFAKNKARGINLSPSQQAIRDFKKSEAKKCVSSPSFLDMTKTSTTEWQVLYTTQVTQKAKKFHDGFLQLAVRGSQGRQVMLYDITRRHLNSRFLKKDEMVCSGESLAFEGHLVEIGEQEGDHKPIVDLAFQGKNSKVDGKTYIDTNQANISINKRFSCGKSSDNTCPEKFTDLNDSSSKIDKTKLSSRTPANEPRRADFKKSEAKKCVSSPSFLDMTKTSTTEWQVLYTTQVTQKAKKFHDGFLQLAVCGLQGRQVMLYDITRRHLNSRFLKKYEIVCSGESLAFEGHLVEIGEQEGYHKPTIDLTFQGKNCKPDGKTYIDNNQAKSPINEKISSGKSSDNTCPDKVTDHHDSCSKIDKAKLSSRTPANEPRRAVHDILSFLQKPTQRQVDSHASDVHSNMKGFAEECNGSELKELGESISVPYPGVKVVKSETVVVLNGAQKCGVSEYVRESQDRSSRFCVRAGATNSMTPIFNVECTNHNMTISSSALDLEGQMSIDSATLTRSSKPANLTEVFSCEEVTADTTAAATHVLSSTKFPKLQEDNKGSSSRHREAHPSVADTEEKIYEHNLPAKETCDFPSFDLGF